MKVVLLAGGFGTRLSEETETRPKPMVQIGDKPILWHIMKTYSHYGLNDFVICLGYKGYFIKEYFSNYLRHSFDMVVDLKNNKMEIDSARTEPWVIRLIDTGLHTLTGGRIKRVRDHVNQGTFMVTYGDGVANINIKDLLEYHRGHGKLATITAVQPPGRFGALNLDPDNRVLSFQEKPRGDQGWINGGFFVLEPGIFDYIENDQSIWEREPLERLAADGQLVAYHHREFWKPMDTLRDLRELQDLWNSGKAPWKIWND